VNYCRPHAFGPEEQGLLLALARRAAAALENARLFDRSERRSRELTSLLEVSRNLVGTLALKPLLGVVLDQLKAVIEYESAAIMTLEGDHLLVQDYRGPRVRDDVVERRFALAPAVLFRQVVERGAPLIIADTHADTAEARAFRGRAENVQRVFASTRSWMGVPLAVKDRTIGMLRLDHPEPGRFGPADAALALAIANQAAVAIENARLYEQAQAQATAEERQRLARELHDAVTQTLFSASLIAEVVPRIWERDPEKGRARLEEVRQLTRGALAEMRSLLLELRPAALTQTGLGDLLRQLAEAFQGRARVPARVTVAGEGAVPPDVQVALYRVAQEALNNAAKYAQASTVEVALKLREGGVELSIADDGLGFDPTSIQAGHLGIGIMRERCARIGAALSVDSAEGRGTRVAVRWPHAPDEGRITGA
jgi:signal transduction histidine kinase